MFDTFEELETVDFSIKEVVSFQVKTVFHSGILVADEIAVVRIGSHARRCPYLVGGKLSECNAASRPLESPFVHQASSKGVGSHIDALAPGDDLYYLDRRCIFVDNLGALNRLMYAINCAELRA